MNLAKVEYPLLLLLAIFVLAWLTPLGYAVWILYLVPLILASRLADSRGPLLTAAVGSGLIVIGYFLSPPGIEPIVAIFNRAVGIATLWITAALLQKRTRAEEELRESARKLSSTVSSLPGYVYRCLNQPDWPVAFVSEGVFDLLGYTAEEFMSGKLTAASTVVPADRDRVWAEMQKAIAARRSYVIEYRIRTATGEERWVWEKGAGVFDGDTVVALEGFVTDITERKQAEEALRESEERLRLVLDGLRPHMFVGLLDLEGRVLLANLNALEAAGLRPEDVQGKPVADTYWFAFSQSVAERLRAAVQRAAQGEEVRYDEQIRVAEGRFIWLDFSIQPLRDASGIITFLVPSAIVITERKQAEAALAEREERLRLFIEHSPVALAMFDRDMRYLAASRRWMADYRLGDGPLIGRSHYEVFPEVTERWKDVHRRGLAGAVERCEEDPFVRVDGRTDWLRWEVRPWRTVGGDIGGIVIFTEDITEHKLAEKTLQDSTERFRQVTEHIHEVFWMTDPAKNTMLYVSPAYEDIWGRSCASLYASPRDWLDAIHPDDRERVLRAAATKQLTGEYDETYRITHPDGTVRWIQDRAFPAHNERGDVDRVVGVAQDITARKDATAQRDRLARRLLAVQEEERQAIARDLHDEIGQELSVLKLTLSGLECAIPAGETPLVRDGIKITERLLKQVRELALELRPSILDDLGLAAAVEWYADRLAERSDFVVEHRVDSNLTGLPADLSITCFRVAQEALTNIARHAKPRRVLVSLRRLDGGLELAVRDDGVGFDVDAALAKGHQGRCLGLLGMQERVQLVGGHNRITSAPGRGTEILATFPVDSSHGIVEPHRAVTDA